jgi:coenzyme PQQ precursor peptide PqqA
VIVGPRAGKLQPDPPRVRFLFAASVRSRRVFDQIATALCWRLRQGRSLRKLWAVAQREGCEMTWTTPTLVEICIGLEINGYLPAEF